MKKSFFASSIAAAALLAVCGSSYAFTAGLPAVVKGAVERNPSVLAKKGLLRAAEADVGIARAAWLPRVDVSADIKRNSQSGGVGDSSIGSAGVAVTASQTLWDGGQTGAEVTRAQRIQRVRALEVEQAASGLALDVAEAYINVHRARALVAAATESLAEHQRIVSLLSARADAGVGRGVDLDQATARLALATANLTTEKMNLHDVSERYLKLAGAEPPAEMSAGGLAVIDEAAKIDASAHISAALDRNAGILAAAENVLAAQAQAEQRRGLYQPVIDVYARGASGRNLDAVSGVTGRMEGGVSLKWNLFAGGADQARVRQAAALIGQAEDLRESVCRDVRQTAATAIDAVTQQAGQVESMRSYQAATGRVWAGYKIQFDQAIAGRSLLDVLNAANENFAAVRSAVNAEHDMRIANARALASRSGLLQALGVSGDWDADGNRGAATTCKTAG